VKQPRKNRPLLFSALLLVTLLALAYCFSTILWVIRAVDRPIPIPFSLFVLRALEPLFLILAALVLFYFLARKGVTSHVMAHRPTFRKYITMMLAASVIVYTAAFIYFTLQRHWHFNSAGYDLGIQDQVIWNTIQGRWFESSIEVNNYLGDHFQPLVVLLAPIYWVWSSPQVLLVLQTIVLSLGAIPTYRLAKRRLQSPFFGLAFALCYLLYPSIGYINRFDFHWEVTVIPLLLAAIVSADEDRWSFMSLFLFLAMLGKEEIGLTIAAFGLWIWWKKRTRIGLVWTFIGTLFSLAALFLIIPAFRQAPSDTLARYAWLGSTPIVMVQTLFSQPRMIILHLANRDNLSFLVSLFGPVLFLPFFSSLSLVLIPGLAYNLLSASSAQHSVYYQYVAPMIPFVIASAIYGLENLLFRLPSLNRDWIRITIIMGLITASLWFAAYVNNPLIDNGLASAAWSRLPNEEAVRAGLDQIGADDAVFTTNHYTPHLSQRRKVFTYFSRGDSSKITQADTLFFNLCDQRCSANGGACYDYSEILKEADLLGFGLVYQQDAVVILRRGEGELGTAEELMSNECR
jgi:uncharacterized membrane protein